MLAAAAPSLALAQSRAEPPSKAAAPATAPQFDSASLAALQWRNIGPFRGGRVVAVTGVPEQPRTFYFGGVGGGVWKSTDGGDTWANITDGQLKTASVGAIAVAPSDPNVIYVGMGEHPIRGVMTSHGDGVYKSTDAGRTWTHVGLDRTRQISRIRIHPADPDTRLRRRAGRRLRPDEGSRCLPLDRRRHDLDAGALRERDDRRVRTGDGSDQPAHPLRGDVGSPA